MIRHDFIASDVDLEQHGLAIRDNYIGSSAYPRRLAYMFTFSSVSVLSLYNTCAKLAHDLTISLLSADVKAHFYVCDASAWAVYADLFFQLLGFAVGEVERILTRYRATEIEYRVRCGRYIDKSELDVLFMRPSVCEWPFMRVEEFTGRLAAMRALACAGAFFGFELSCTYSTSTGRFRRRAWAFSLPLASAGLPWFITIHLQQFAASNLPSGPVGSTPLERCFTRALSGSSAVSFSYIATPTAHVSYFVRAAAAVAGFRSSFLYKAHIEQYILELDYLRKQLEDVRGEAMRVSGDKKSEQFYHLVSRVRAHIYQSNARLSAKAGALIDADREIDQLEHKLAAIAESASQSLYCGQYIVKDSHYVEKIALISPAQLGKRRHPEQLGKHTLQREIRSNEAYIDKLMKYLAAERRTTTAAASEAQSQPISHILRETPKKQPKPHEGALEQFISTDGRVRVFMSRKSAVQLGLSPFAKALFDQHMRKRIAVRGKEYEMACTNGYCAIFLQKCIVIVEQRSWDDWFLEDQNRIR